MRHIRAGLALLALSSLAACDIPTAAPRYDTTWDVPAKNMTLSVNTFLPNGITSTTDNTAFQVSLSPASSTISRQLGQDCNACALANGTTIPKPAFTGGGTASVAFPAGVTSATLIRDTLNIAITNNFNFDPIRPSASARGYLVITVKNGSTVIGKDSINGANLALPPGSTTARQIGLQGTITGASGLQISTAISSPLGDPVQINSGQTFVVTGSANPLFVSSAQVSLNNQTLTAPGTEFDLSNAESIGTDVKSGSLLLAVDNPFAATGTLQVNITGGNQPINKSITLGTGVTTPSIDFSRDELQAMFGNVISIAFSGSASGTSVTVTPGQTVNIAAHLQVIVHVGGGLED